MNTFTNALSKTKHPGVFVLIFAAAVFSEKGFAQNVQTQEKNAAVKNQERATPLNNIATDKEIQQVEPAKEILIMTGEKTAETNIQKLQEYQYIENVNEKAEKVIELTPEEKYKDDPAALEEIKYMKNSNRERNINSVKMQLTEADKTLSEIKTTLAGIKGTQGISEEVKKTKQAELQSKQNDLFNKKQMLLDELKLLEAEK